MRKINEMSEIWDMGKFPFVIYCGATANILATIWVTSYVYWAVAGDVRWLLPWAVILPLVNIFFVVALRFGMPEPLEYPLISQTNFWSDQHRFSTWVYVVAGFNMFFWISFGWWSQSMFPESTSLNISLAVAFVVTFVPLWRWIFR